MAKKQKKKIHPQKSLASVSEKYRLQALPRKEKDVQRT